MSLEFVASRLMFGPLSAAASAWARCRASLGRGFRRERRLRETRLARECAVLRDALESIGDGFGAFDRSGRMVLCNHRLFELLDLPRGVGREANLRNILMHQARRGDFGAGNPEAQVHERCDAFLREAAGPAERFSVGGRTIQVQRRAMEEGIVLALYSDITDRRAAEERLTQAWVEADLGNRAKSEFLANMSHELRTPLNAIIGFSEIVCEEMLGPVGNERYLEYMHDIHSSGTHLLAIVNDVLDMSKIEAGKLDLQFVPVDVGAVVDDAVRMLGDRAGYRGIRVEIAELAVDTVVADERAIKQIVLNLLSNAVKFSPDKGEVVVRTRREADGGVMLAVEDHGIGMTEAGIERALQPFGQVNTAATRSQSGTGLGLPITKGLAEAHGGRLVIESAPGQGTTVRVILPREPGRKPAAADERAVA